MRLRITASALALLALTACNGPKDSCEGTYNSYVACMKGHDWECVFELLTPEFKRKAGNPKRVAIAMEEGQWLKGSKSFKVNVFDIAETKAGICTARGTMSYTIKNRGENPRDVKDEYFAWTFRLEKDGLWYMELPGSEKLQAF
jgi:hypothetical protein